MSELGNVAKGAMEWEAGKAARETKSASILKKADKLDRKRERYADHGKWRGADDVSDEFEDHLIKHVKDKELVNSLVNDFYDNSYGQNGLDIYTNINARNILKNYLDKTQHLNPKENDLFHKILPASINYHNNPNNEDEAWYSPYHNENERTGTRGISINHAYDFVKNIAPKLDEMQKDTYIKLLPQHLGTLPELETIARLL